MEVISEGIKLHVARAHFCSMAEEAERIQELCVHAVGPKLTPKVDPQLRRVARLYVLGFSEEVAALARAALEAALSSEMDEPTVRRIAAVPVGRSISFGHRIKAAKKAGIFPPGAAEAATVIQTRGNNALHDGTEPLDAVGGPLGIVRRLAVCLEVLGPRVG